MAKPHPAHDHATEPCPTCDRRTPHEVRVELRTESEDAENARFSREPYRITVCQDCGVESTTRMNNA